MTDLERESNIDVVYNRKVRTVVRTDGKEERRSEINVTVELHHGVGAFFRKELVIKLTDESDVFFLLNLKINEEDFQILKSHQGLLVDFTSFPQKFIELLENCRLEECKEAPKFLLSLSLSSSGNLSSNVLDIVETNPFKHLVHLSLKFISGSDADIKKYLASRLKAFKNYTERLELQLQNTEKDLKKKLQILNESLISKSAELDQLRLESKDQILKLQNHFTYELSAEKDKALKIGEDLHNRYDKEFKDIEYNHKHAKDQFELRASALESHNKELQDLRYKLDQSNLELRNRVKILEEELHYAREDNQRLRTESSSLENVNKELERTVAQMKSQAIVLDQELRSKQETVIKQQHLVETLQENNKRQEESLEQKQQLLNKRESSVKSLSDELNKGNEIIRKLQQEVRSQHAKLKLRSRIASEQEKIILEKGNEMQSLNKDIVGFKEEIHKRDLLINDLKQSLDVSNSKLEEKEQVIRTNENVINWLNKQLNQSEINRQGTSNGIVSKNYEQNYSPLSNISQNYRPQLSSNNASVPLLNKEDFQNKVSQVRYSSVQTGWMNQMDSIPEQRNKENEPTLDPKYLQPASLKTVPVSGINTKENLRSSKFKTPSPSSISPPNSLQISSTNARLPRMVIAPIAPTGPPKTPSSYFPNTTSTPKI